MLATAHLATAFDLGTVCRFLKSVGLARAWDEATQGCWRARLTSETLTAALQLLPGSSPEGILQEHEFPRYLVEQRATYLFESFVDGWLRATQRGAGHAFLETMDELRAGTLQNLAGKFLASSAGVRDLLEKLRAAVLELSEVARPQTIAGAGLGDGVAIVSRGPALVMIPADSGTAFPFVTGWEAGRAASFVGVALGKTGSGDNLETLARKIHGPSRENFLREQRLWSHAVERIEFWSVQQGEQHALRSEGRRRPRTARRGLVAALPARHARHALGTSAIPVVFTRGGKPVEANARN